MSNVRIGGLEAVHGVQQNSACLIEKYPLSIVVRKYVAGWKARMALFFLVQYTVFSNMVIWFSSLFSLWKLFSLYIKTTHFLGIHADTFSASSASLDSPAAFDRSASSSFPTPSPSPSPFLLWNTGTLEGTQKPELSYTGLFLRLKIQNELKSFFWRSLFEGITITPP